MERERKPIVSDLKLATRITGKILYETGKPIVKYGWEQTLRNYREWKFRPGRRIL